MERQQRRAVGYLALLAVVVAGYTLAYQVGMAVFEGERVTLVHAFHIVVETFTTTGYGEDASRWDTAGILLLMDAMQLTGVLMLFLTLPLFVVPWVERRLEVDPPESVSLTDHVVICGYTDRVEALIDELDAQTVDYVVVEPDRAEAQELHEGGVTVVHGNAEDTDVLDAVSVPDARAVVLDASDETNATLALSVREVDADVRVVGFVADPSHANYVRYAGADRVLSPHEILGRSLANKVTNAITTDLGETVRLGDDFEVAEMPIQRGSELDGSTLADGRVRERTGANVVGLWAAGEFIAAPDPTRELDRSTILLVAGDDDALTALKELTLTEARRHDRGRVVVAGYGDTGTRVSEILDENDVPHTVVDRKDRPGVDVVGDVSEEETLAEAGLADASALLLALGDDAASVFATLVARENYPDVELLCRANDTRAEPRLYAAGAGYVLALATVSGRMLASTLLGEDVMSLDNQVDLVRTRAPAFVGQTLREAAVRERTGCTVIAVQRDGTVESDPSPEFRIERGDALVVAGTDDDIARFTDLADVRPDAP
ncbi:TrkA family potassium uptake protein [Salarchaeum sp. JOR-1]|uniref:potassium channel family protein n=1 Tax=Salarchaeum sp. JOR-1 TaxID=2599399 RepID=UPI0011989AC1|nr:NAD-binding protein [Salarchaeum sp. JOR-1]QDX39563.1 TrkA family potassium uptake protein [Salarchaeum sp. JOR-1]